MIPAKTMKIVGREVIAQSARFDATGDYSVIGIDLNDLAVLARRLETGMTDADERRDWQNRIALILDRSIDLTPDYDSIRRNGG